MLWIFYKSSGLIKFLITLLSNLELPSIIREAKQQKIVQVQSTIGLTEVPKEMLPLLEIVAIKRSYVQDEIRAQDVILVLLRI